MVSPISRGWFLEFAHGSSPGMMLRNGMGRWNIDPIKILIWWASGLLPGKLPGMLQNFAPGRGPFFSIIKRSAPDGGKPANFVKLPSNSGSRTGGKPGGKSNKTGGKPRIPRGFLKIRGQIRCQMGGVGATESRNLTDRCVC